MTPSKSLRKKIAAKKTAAMKRVERDAKVKALDEITQRLGLTDADVIAVGDGANDLGMLLRAGSGVALHAKPSVAVQCNIRINFGDLTALLYVQGYARSEFVSVSVDGAR